MRKLILFLAAVCGGLSPGLRAQPAGQEIVYPGEAFAKLDTFEGLNLEDADKLFNKKDFTGAYAAYKAYSFEFAKSPALPYVLLRMGRCLHLLGKRQAAIKAYQDVVDYFPDAVVYAAGALYYIGVCHGENGDDDKKLAVWARMVKDDGYVAQPNSGSALTYLGQAMEQLGKYEEAVEYHRRTAVAFLQSNERAAAEARAAVIQHYAARSPNHEKLKAFYVDASGFDGRGQKTDNPEEDARYWTAALSAAVGPRGDAEQREKACAYWSAKMGERFEENDDLRKLWCDVQYAHEKDRDAWSARLEKQFARKPVSTARVLQWCDYYGVDRKRQSEFFAKHGLPLAAGLAKAEKMDLMNRLRHPLGMHDEAQAVMRAVRLDDLSDEETRNYAMFLANYGTEEEVLRVLARVKDPLVAGKARFDYYNARSHRNPPFMEKALAEIPALEKSPQYAGEVAWARGVLLQGLGRYEEAIKAYQAVNRQPDSTWAATDCLVALKRFGEAIRNVQGLESVGGAVAAQACLKAADVYRAAEDKGKEVDQLRLVLRRYPKSGEASAAHQRLENYGLKVIGGEAEAEE